ncbi:hypothetical protein F5051DRAFT_206922 [Lentinula edodes]|nr:hypothetical protein F5051DRAFT_206922 [Lentinula edodes]
MKRMSGEPLQETDVWKSASREHKAKICQKVAQHMLQLTYNLVIQGFLHADFSPSNVLVKFTSMNGQDPELETVYIVDWGHPGIYTTVLTRLPDKKSRPGFRNDGYSYGNQLTTNFTQEKRPQARMELVRKDTKGRIRNEGCPGHNGIVGKAPLGLVLQLITD